MDRHPRRVQDALAEVGRDADRAYRRAAAESALTAPVAHALMAAEVRYAFHAGVAHCPTRAADMAVVLAPTYPGFCRLRFQFGDDSNDYATGVMDGSAPEGLEYDAERAAQIAWNWQQTSKTTSSPTDRIF